MDYLHLFLYIYEMGGYIYSYNLDLIYNILISRGEHYGHFNTGIVKSNHRDSVLLGRFYKDNYFGIILTII